MSNSNTILFFFFSLTSFCRSTLQSLISGQKFGQSEKIVWYVVERVFELSSLNSVNLFFRFKQNSFSELGQNGSFSFSDGIFVRNWGIFFEHCVAHKTRQNFQHSIRHKIAFACVKKVGKTHIICKNTKNTVVTCSQLREELRFFKLLSWQSVVL